MSGTKLSILNAVTQSSPHRSPDPSSFLCQCHYFLEIQSRVVRPIRFFYKTLDLKLYFNVIFEIAGCKAFRAATAVNLSDRDRFWKMGGIIMSCCNKSNCDEKGKTNQDTGSRGLMGLLTGPRRWWVLGAVGVTAGLIFGWDTLVLLGVAPILIFLLPCLIMCGLGLCMNKCKDKKGSVTGVEQAGDAQSVASQSGVSGASHSTKTF
jgi:hypothetical protein